MRHASRWAAALLVVGGLALSGCADPQVGASGTSGEEPSKVEAVAGTDVKKVVLTEQAVTRLGIRTETVSVMGVAGASGMPAVGTTVPYSALLYDTNGDTYVFEVVEPRSYLRKKVDVEAVEGETVIMRSGPEVGATVVTVGAAVLYGTELGTGS